MSSSPRMSTSKAIPDLSSFIKIKEIKPTMSKSMNAILKTMESERIFLSKVRLSMCNDALQSRVGWCYVMVVPFVYSKFLLLLCHLTYFFQYIVSCHRTKENKYTKNIQPWTEFICATHTQWHFGSLIWEVRNVHCASMHPKRTHSI